MTKHPPRHPDYLVVARVESVYRDSPFLKISLFTDYPERFSEGKTVFLEFFGEFKALVIEESYREGAVFFVRLKNFTEYEECAELVGKYLYIPEKEAAPLPEHSYYVHDLIGSKVLASDGELGEIYDVMLLPANDAYVVRNAEGKEILIPALKEIIDSFDAEKKILTLRATKSYLGYED